MDPYINAAASHLKLADNTLRARLDKLEKATTKTSRHYNKIQHTHSMISLIEELRGIVLQDPDMWDEEPDLVPF